MPTALIVEDEPQANKLLAMLVRLQGYQTESAYTGGEALEKIDRRRPDIVFLDLMLPDTNGYEVCETLKARKATSLIPVVMVTARISEENRLRGFHAGADEYIPKPYTPDQIFQALADADAWRQQAGGQVAEGEVPLGVRDEAETLRRIAQLRSLLLARSPLEHAAVAQLGAALEEMATSAWSWARAHRSDRGATLTFHLEDHRLSLTLLDASGWLDESLQQGERWRQEIAQAGFDELPHDEATGRVTFLKPLSLD
jgi:DNA-binding response OmpR family regulator